MNSCKKSESQMIDCIEGQLKSEQQKHLLDHLAHCAQCSIEYRRLQALYDLLSKDSLTLPPRESFETMKDAARKQVLRSRPFTFKNLARVLVPVFAVAAIFLIILKPKDDKIEIRIPVANLIQDGEIARMAMAGVLDRETFEGILAMEDHVLSDTDEAIEEMTSSEKNEFMISLHRRYPLGT